MAEIYSYEEALDASRAYFNCDPNDVNDNLPAKVFLDKYALRDNDGNLLEKTPDQMHRRLAREFARIEKKKFKKPYSEDYIFSLLDRFGKIIPQGSPMYGIGNHHQYASLSNCYVVPPPLDSYSSICRTDEKLVQISKRRGGVGTDLSHIRPAGSKTQNAARTSTGIIPFMKRYSNSIREVGQCLAGNTLILSKNGLKRIDEITNGDEVWTENEWVKVIDVFTNIKDTVVIKTKYGRQIECSEDHVFHTADGEMAVKEMSIGTKITAIRGNGWDGENVGLEINEYVRKGSNHSNRLVEREMPLSLNKDLAYLLGNSYGDGYVEQQQDISIALSTDWPVIDTKVFEIVQKELGITPTYKGNTVGNYKVLKICSTQFLSYLKDNGLLKQKAENIVFPKKLLSAPTEIVMAFIAGYFDADGGFVKSKKVFKIDSICESFLLTIQNILLAHGIISKIQKTIMKHPWRDIYRLSINGRRSQSIFRKLLHESIKVSSAPKWTDKVRDFSRTAYKIGDYGSSSSRHSYVIDNKQYITYSTSERLCNDLGIMDNRYLLQDEVISIETGAKNQNVYDLVLENTHLFFANGLYAHNSGRRGALMLTLSIHHPESVVLLDDNEKPEPIVVKNDDMADIHTTTEYYNPSKLDFVSIKYNLKNITGANISLRLSDEFMNAVVNGEKYQQRWPVDSTSPSVIKWVDAKKAWDKIVHSAHAVAEPGILMWDNIIRESPADSYQNFTSVSTNPCSELPLSANDSCRLLLLNLFGYVVSPFSKDAFFDFKAFYKDSIIAQRLMDDMVDLEIECINNILRKVENDPEPDDIKMVEKQLWLDILKSCTDGRRTGTGITALGDTIAALGIAYGSEEGKDITGRIYKTLKFGAYSSSVEMAKELGTFPVWNHDVEKNNPFINRLKEETCDLRRSNLTGTDASEVIYGQHIWDEMKKCGRRNIALLTTAPAGSVSIISKLINRFGTSSGLEPQFDVKPYVRKKKGNPGDTNFRVDSVDQNGDSWMHFNVYSPAIREWMDVTGESDFMLSPWHNNCANDLDWTNRVRLQSVAQLHCDHSLSSTINLPNNTPVDKVKEIYETAWRSGCKGITIYRDGCRTGVLVRNEKLESKMPKTNAPKRPSSLSCDVFHIKVKGEAYFVIVGKISDSEPYEVFAGKNGMISKNVKHGVIVKKSRGKYDAKFDDDSELKNVAEYLSDEEEAVTRMVSTSLRHGADVTFIVHQLEKTKGSLFGFSKAMARALRTYVNDDIEVQDTGDVCKENGCGGKIIRTSGCYYCLSCGSSKCS